MQLSDEELVRAFEAATLPGDQFDHAAHVRVGWWYLRHLPIGIAIDKFQQGIRAFAAAQGALHKYHETITVAYMLLIAERLSGAERLDWATFAVRFPELLDKNPPLVTRYYTPEVLASDRARGAFVMPARLRT
jgi:hypothetical protein